MIDAKMIAAPKQSTEQAVPVTVGMVPNMVASAATAKAPMKAQAASAAR